MSSLTDDPSTPQGRRRARTEARLRDALDQLASDPSSLLTVAALARAAGIGRNVIYTHHASILADLRRIQASGSSGRADAAAKADDGRATILTLENKVISLATENAGLLQRALEAEARVEHAERRNAQLTRELARMRSPAPIHSHSAERSAGPALDPNRAP